MDLDSAILWLATRSVDSHDQLRKLGVAKKHLNGAAKDAWAFIDEYREEHGNVPPRGIVEEEFAVPVHAPVEDEEDGVLTAHTYVVNALFERHQYRSLSYGILRAHEALNEGEQAESVEEVLKLADALRSAPTRVAKGEWMTAADIAEPLPDTPWVVQGLYLAPGRVHLVVGKGYSGKTLMMQAMAIAIAAGRPVWGRFGVPKPMRSKHIDLEMGPAPTKRRYQRIALAMGVDLASLGDRLQLRCMPSYRLDDDDVEGLMERECEGADLVIIDSFRVAIKGDENASEARVGLDLLTRVSIRTGTTIVVIHHGGKASKGDGRDAGRGSSAIFDACGTVLNADVSKDDEEVKLISMAKASGDAEGGSIRPFKVRITDVAVEGGAVPGLSVEVVEDTAPRSKYDIDDDDEDDDDVPY